MTKGSRRRGGEARLAARPADCASGTPTPAGRACRRRTLRNFPVGVLADRSASRLLFRRAGIDAEHVPMVPVEIAEASPVQEALVVGLIGGQGTGHKRFVGEFVDPVAALVLQLHDRLARGGGVRSQSLADG